MSRVEPIADVLVFKFAPFEGLAVLRDWGMLDREWSLYERLKSYYPRMVVVTYGDERDVELAASLLGETEKGKVEVVCNRRGLDWPRYVGSIAGEVDGILRRWGDCRRVVIKTHQMWNGDAAVKTAAVLRTRGLSVGLVARAGYLWSKTFARIHGCDSPIAMEAAMVEGELCRAADVVVATTESMREDLAWRHGVADARTRVIPNFVLTDREPIGVDGRDETTLLYCGRIAPEKRLDLVVRAMAALPEPERSRVRFRIQGQGDLEQDVRALAGELGVRLEVQPRIPHREMLGQMERSAIYIQTSAYEGHPRTVIEALSTGAPTIVTDTAGQGDAVEHLVTGLRVGSDVGSISAALLMMLRDRGLRARLSESAARRTREALGIGRWIAPEVSIHREAVARAGGALAGDRVALPGSVRWDPMLLDEPAGVSSAAWNRSLECFARRMSVRERAEMLEQVAQGVSTLLSASPGEEALNSLHEPRRGDSGKTGAGARAIA